MTYNKIQQKKFSELLKEYPPRNDPEKVIFNFSEATLNESEKALLSRGLNFSLPPKQLKYVDYLLNFELFFRDICKLEILSNKNLEFLKTKIKDVALSSLRYFNLNVPQHLSDSEFQALKNLSCLKKEVIIQKSGKGNSVVLVNKSDYIRYTEDILKDVSKFEKVSLKKGILTFTVNQEEHINKQLRSISKNGSLTEQQYKKIKAVGSNPGILYGLCKVHKTVIDVCPPFRLILSAIGTPTYKLAKYLVPKLASITAKIVKPISF